MPEGFSSIDDMKVAITASTENLQAGLDGALAMLGKFAKQGEGELGKFDGALAKVGRGIETGKIALNLWVQAAEAGLGVIGTVLEKVEGLASRSGMGEEWKLLKDAVSGFGESLQTGLTAPFVELDRTARSTAGSLAEIQRAAAQARTMASETSEFELFKTGELAEIIARNSGQMVETTRAVAVSAPAATVALEGYAAAAAKFRSANTDLARPFGAAPATWAEKLAAELKTISLAMEVFASDASKSKNALEGQLHMEMNAFEGMHKRLQDLKSGNFSLKSLILGDSEASLLKSLDALAEKIRATKAELASRPVADPTVFQSGIDALDAQVAALEQKVRIFDMAAGDAAKLVAEEKILLSLGKEMKDLSESERNEIAVRTEMVREHTDELVRLAAAKELAKGIEGVLAEAEQIELRTKLVGRSADEVARLTAELKIQQAAKQRNIELTDEQSTKLGEYTTRVGQATLALKAREAALAATRAIETLGDQADALDRQIRTYGMAAGAVAALAAEEKVLADARKAGIALSTAQQDALQDETLRIEELTNRKVALDKAKAFDRELGAAEREADAMARKVHVMFMEAGAAAELTLREKLLSAARREGVELSDAQRQRIDDLARSYGHAAREAKEFETALSVVRDAGQIASRTLTSAFDQWMRGQPVKTKDMVDQMLRELARLGFVKSFVDPSQNLLGSLFGTALRGIGGGVGGGWETTVIPALADGGPAMAGRPHLVGERGPELFVPSMSGMIVPRHELGGGGGPPNVNVQVINNAGAEIGIEETSAGVMVMVDAAIDAKIRSYDKGLQSNLAQKTMRQ